MDVVSTCPLPVSFLIWQRASTWVLTVVCRATFQLRPGEATLAAQQEAPNNADAHWDNDPPRSLRAVSDLVPLKPLADVLLVGLAYAPGGRPVRSLVARLAVGTIDKSISLHCDRSIEASGSMREGASFARMPIVYERAAGGPSTWNPVGVQHGARDHQGGVRLPNLQARDLAVTSSNDIIAPLGFGPISPTWPTRLEKLGRHKADYATTAWRSGLLPDDVDPAYFNAAPHDQQLSRLREDERILLENLHPEHPRLVTTLPGIRPTAVLEARGGSYPIAIHCDTLWIDTALCICTLTWRGQVPLSHPKEAGRVVVALEQALRVGRQPMLSGTGFGADAPQIDDGTGTLTGTLTATPDAASASALPFARSSGPQHPRPPVSPHQGGALPFTSAGSDRPQSPVLSAPDTTSTPALPRTSEAVSWPQPPAPIPPTPVVASVPRATDDSPWAAGAPREALAPVTIGSAAASSAASAAPSGPKDRGVFSASNAAAGSSSVGATPRVESAPAPLAQGRPAVRPAARMDSREVLQIIWFDPEAVPRICRKAPWRSILDAMEEEGTVDPDDEDPARAKNPAEVEDRRDVFAILVKGEAVESEGINDGLAAGVRDDGRHVPALLLVAGELSFPFDELETLKATVTTVSPLVGADENLKSTIDTAKEFLKTPDLRSAPAVAEGLTTRIREAFAQGRRAVPTGYLDAQTERVLLDQRCYQRRTVFGGEYLRALLSTGGSSSPIPTYLPEALAKKLPLYQHFKARLIAWGELAVDQHETHPAALKVAALGRLAPAPGRR